MALLEAIAAFAVQDWYLFFVVCVLCTAAWGDATLILFISISMALHIPLWISFTAAYIGTLIGDAVWFKIGLIIEKKIEKREKLKEGYKKIAYLIDKVFHRNLFLALGAAKLLAGTRVIMTFYFAKEKIEFWKFFRYNLLATLFWVSLIGSVGIAIGYGLNYVSQIFEGLQWTVSIIIIILILFHLLQKKINDWIEA